MAKKLFVCKCARYICICITKYVYAYTDLMSIPQVAIPYNFITSFYKRRLTVVRFSYCVKGLMFDISLADITNILHAITNKKPPMVIVTKQLSSQPFAQDSNVVIELWHCLCVYDITFYSCICRIKSFGRICNLNEDCKFLVSPQFVIQYTGWLWLDPRYICISIITFAYTITDMVSSTPGSNSVQL